MFDVLVVILAHEIDHFSIEQRPHVQSHGPRFGENLGVVDGHIDV
jgi:hypothetical protein